MSQSAMQKFINSTRELFAAETDPAKRWAKMPPLLQELLADPSIKEQSKSWPDCSQGSERAENLLFYEDPDYKFVINGLIKSLFFGIAVTLIAVFEGFDATPTAAGVSSATTRTVVTSALVILALDFVLTAFMF